MSRGPGRVMRAALDELDECGEATAWGVACRLAGDGWPTRSQLVSARRALHSLTSSGKVRLTRVRTGDATPPTLTAKRCQPGVEDNTYRDVDIPVAGRRKTDRCDSCARPFAEVGIATTFYSDSDMDAGVYNVRGLALCRDCNDGLTDPIAIASNGEYAIDRMPPVPCGKCGGELSEAGLRLVYINGAKLPRCDACRKRDAEETMRAIGSLLGIDDLE